uniref:ADP-ribosylation factor-like protein 13B n=1 Tax=Rhabditophanes sp. KR3021 TaxID=114890 RepID=A0AC35TRQ9_9BILA
MGNCAGGFLKKSNAVAPFKGDKVLTLCMVGPKASGKTSLVSVLKNGPADDVLTTNGFNQDEFKFNGAHIKLYDLGGALEINEIWPNYYGESHGGIFVLDCSNSGELELAKELITKFAQHIEMVEKPILVFLNKQETEEHFDEHRFNDFAGLEQLAMATKCTFKVTRCSVKRGFGKTLDPAITAGMNWLIGEVVKNYDKLNVGVAAHLEMLKKKQQEDKIVREHRLALLEAEREEEAKKAQAEILPINLYDGEEPYTATHILSNLQLPEDERLAKANSLPPLNTGAAGPPTSNVDLFVVPQNESRHSNRSTEMGQSIEMTEFKPSSRGKVHSEAQTELSLPVQNLSSVVLTTAISDFYAFNAL